MTHFPTIAKKGNKTCGRKNRPKALIFRSFEAYSISISFSSFQHDPENNKACVPGGEDGNYIMYARATSGDKKNNRQFSPCSLKSVREVGEAVNTLL